MKDVEYAIKVLNSKVYGLRDAMVDNADVYRKFVKEVRGSFDILRKRLTRLERRQNCDRLAIYLLIYKIWRMDLKVVKIDEKVGQKETKKVVKDVPETRISSENIVFE